MEQNNEDKKSDVIKWLKEFNRLSTSRFTGLLAMDFYKAKELLESMGKENILIKEEETNAVYWLLKNDILSHHK